MRCVVVDRNMMSCSVLYHSVLCCSAIQCTALHWNTIYESKLNKDIQEKLVSIRIVKSVQPLSNGYVNIFLDRNQVLPMILQNLECLEMKNQSIKLAISILRWCWKIYGVQRYVGGIHTRVLNTHPRNSLVGKVLLGQDTFSWQNLALNRLK